MNRAIRSTLLSITIVIGLLFDIEAMSRGTARHSIARDTTVKQDGMLRRRIIPRRYLQPRNTQLMRQLSPERTFTRMGHFGQFRTPQRLRAQRHYLKRIFRGRNWHWWWRHRPHIFYTYFPFFFYNTYGYYPPIYYDYFDVYGTYPIAYSYIAPA